MIIKKNLSEQIYDSLRKSILEQKVRFGEKLVNRQLQEKYGVSSTPVRDAINRLYLDGLLEEISNGGARVISFDYKAALEVNEIVAMFTKEALALSATKLLTSELVPELEASIEMQHKNVHNKNYFVFDKKFHTAFFTHCSNARLVQLNSQYSALWEILVLFYYSDKESDRGKAISEHEKITAAIRKNDIRSAQEQIEHHYQEAVRPLRNQLEMVS